MGGLSDFERGELVGARLSGASVTKIVTDAKCIERDGL
jgi:hypothetical protein